MTDLIPLIKTNLESEEVTAVDARTLHEFLELNPDSMIGLPEGFETTIL